MVVLKSSREIGLMKAAGSVVAEAHAVMRELAVPGTRTKELDFAAEKVFNKYGAEPLFRGVRAGRNTPPFPAVVCASINEEVVHGIPGERVLQEGDILSLDTGCKLNGWCGDAATTLPIGQVSDEAKKLLEVTEKTLLLAIEQMGRRKRWSEVAGQMEQYVHQHGYTVVEQFVGHGIGRSMHEEPQVPNFVSPVLKKKDIWLEPGLVLAIEPMVNVGSKAVQVLKDKWTVATKDRKLSAHFEHTVAMTANGPEILSLPA